MEFCGKRSLYEAACQQPLSSAGRHAAGNGPGDEYTAGLTLAMFLVDTKTYDAVVRNLEIIGEAAKRLPLAIQAMAPQLPWSQMYRLRNIVSHEYFGVDHKMIYRVATEHLPGNRRDVAALLTQLPPPDEE